MSQDNQQQNQQKQKGGGGGAALSGVQWGGKLDPATMRDNPSLGTLISDQLIVAGTATIATVAMYGLTRLFRQAFHVDMEKPKQVQSPGGGGGSIQHPGQIIGILKGLDSNPNMTPDMRKRIAAAALAGLPTEDSDEGDEEPSDNDSQVDENE